MKVQYKLDVRGEVTCANDPKTIIPVFIFSDPPFYQKPQLQMAWQPQVGVVVGDHVAGGRGNLLNVLQRMISVPFFSLILVIRVIRIRGFVDWIAVR